MSIAQHSATYHSWDATAMYHRIYFRNIPYSYIIVDWKWRSWSWTMQSEDCYHDDNTVQSGHHISSLWRLRTDRNILVPISIQKRSFLIYIYIYIPIIKITPSHSRLIFIVGILILERHIYTEMDLCIQWIVVSYKTVETLEHWSAYCFASNVSCYSRSNIVELPTT